MLLAATSLAASPDLWLRVWGDFRALRFTGFFGGASKTASRIFS